MKKMYLLLVCLSMFGNASSQSTREELERNRVKHVTITGWTRTPDGKVIEKADKMRVEKDYDLKGNNTSTVVFISYMNTKHDSIHFDYDESNRCIEVAAYEFGQTTALLLERQRKQFDKKGNTTFYSLENGQGKRECQYSYRFDNGQRLIERTSRCNGSRGSTETITYELDKKGNVVMEKSSTSTPVKYIIKYYKGTNKMESKLNLSNSRQEFFDQNGALVKISQPGMNILYKYDQQGNVIELTEDNWQSSVTGARVYRQVFDQANHLIEKVEVSAKSPFDESEKWIYTPNGLLEEHTKGTEIEKFQYQFHN